MAKNNSSNAAVLEPEGATATTLSVIPPERFLALSPSAELAEAEAAAAATGESFGPSDLIHVPTPSGGATQWTVPGPGGDETTPAIEGVLVCWQPCGVLWPSLDPAPGSLPVLRTFNPTDPNAVAEQVGPIPDAMLDSLNRHKISDGPPATFRWANLPQNQWGSGKGGIGKMAKEQRIMFVLREKSMFPVIIRVQPGSLKDLRKWFNTLRQTGVPYFRCVVRLTLARAQSKNGQPFSKIVPSLVGTLPSDVGAKIRETYTDKLQTIMRDVALEAGRSEEDE